MAPPNKVTKGFTCLNFKAANGVHIAVPYSDPDAVYRVWSAKLHDDSFVEPNFMSRQRGISIVAVPLKHSALDGLLEQRVLE